jgi:hypothetical protein
MPERRAVLGGASCSAWPTLEVLWADDEPNRESYTWLTIGFYEKQFTGRIFFQWIFTARYLEHLGEYAAMMRENELE